LLDWKLKLPASPMAPTFWPRQEAPTACAASSITLRLWLLATPSTASMSAGWPAMCTAMIARVRGVTFRPASAASMR
jgi:hypothetical protein